MEYYNDRSDVATSYMMLFFYVEWVTYMSTDNRVFGTPTKAPPHFEIGSGTKLPSRTYLAIFVGSINKHRLVSFYPAVCWLSQPVAMTSQSKSFSRANGWLYPTNR